MSKILETRKERCRCGTEEKYIKEFAKYGWSFSSKQLLNRFGNPLPLGTNISEAEKREKCFYDLTFIREFEKETIDKLNSLQEEGQNLKLTQQCFTGKRVTSCVFLTIFAIAFAAGLFITYKPDNNTWTFFLTGVIVTILALAAIIVTGVFVVKRNCKNNDVVRERKKIKRQLDELIKREKQASN